MRRLPPGTSVCLLVLGACSTDIGVGDDGVSSFSSAQSDGTADESTTEVDTGASSSSSEDEESTTEDSGGTKFDTEDGSDFGGTKPPSCKVEDDMDAVPPCTDQAPPNSFDPEVQWEWTMPPQDTATGGKDAIVTPLVANLTDDNDDGEIDLCDTPDIIVIGGDLGGSWLGSRLYILDGETGSVHAKTEPNVNISIVPAVGDIDGDGLPEIVASAGGVYQSVTVYEHDLTVKWHRTGMKGVIQGASASLADLDADGDTEIIMGHMVLDHEGETLWQFDALIDGGFFETTGPAVAVDLDDDDDLEIVWGGRKTTHHDGSIYYEHDVEVLQAGFPHVADVDGDGKPEIVVTSKDGVALLEDDGTITFDSVVPAGASGMRRPAAIHDFDGDDEPEIALASRNLYGVYEADVTPVWEAAIVDESGAASSTAFDFLGDGLAEAIYGDETKLWAFDDNGQSLLTVERVSPTQIEYPVVADVDNDQSAEVVVVSSAYFDYPNLEPTTVKVIRDADDRWIPARRIWNQHAYHVTNVREDGTIPQIQPKHWEGLNTFRTQAQLSAGGICIPEG